MTNADNKDTETIIDQNLIDNAEADLERAGSIEDLNQTMRTEADVETPPEDQEEADKLEGVQLEPDEV